MSPLASANGLAVLGGEQRGEAVEFLLHQVEELEHHARAPLRIGRGPGRLRGLRVGDRVLDLRRLASATLAWTSPVLGLNTSPKRPELPSTSLPPMKWPISRIVVLPRLRARIEQPVLVLS